MSKRYQNLLSPMKVGNTVFKNRLTASPCVTHFIQGPELYPTEGMITHYANKAKNGAALVTCTGVRALPLAGYENLHSSFFRDDNLFAKGPRSMRGHFATFDATNGACQNYLSQLAEAIHFYGSKATMQILPSVPDKHDVSAEIPSIFIIGSGHPPSISNSEIPADMLCAIADNFASLAVLMKEMAFDGVFLHMSYRMRLLGRFLSPITNKRTDQYGGSIENRARFPIMVFDRIREKCGADFLIEASLSGCEPKGGFTLDDAIKYTKLFSGHIDMLQIKGTDIDLSHPTGYNPERTPFLSLAEAIKKSGTVIKIGTVGGYQDLDVCEEIISSGKVDYIAMARSWISNPNYGRKAYEGRGEDVVPCLRCNKCHKSSYADPWTSVCSVNPIWGLEHKIERMIEPPTRKKKIAVVGGGPGGLESALVAHERGHNVTLYEKSDALGGILKTADDVSFKWPLKDFKNYLIRQVQKSNIKVRLNTEATVKMLKKENYDVIIAAVGSEPIVPEISGIDSKNVCSVLDVYGNANTLADNVVIIGGGEVGVETGMYLADKGHSVTVLEMTDILARDATPIHFYSMLMEAWEKRQNFKYILQARCNGIKSDEVTYIDASGNEQAIEAGCVVIAVGMKPKSDLALEFYGAGDRFFMVGDCNGAGNVQRVMRNAFSTASML